jgi:hypothetical protein
MKVVVNFYLFPILVHRMTLALVAMVTVVVKTIY